MAETVTIVELDIDQEQLLKDIVKLQQEITDLKDDTKQLTAANKTLEKEGKKNTDQYKANSAQIEKNKVQTKGLSTEYGSNQKTLVALNATETKQLGTLQKLEIQNKELRTEAKQLDLTRKDGQKRLTQINKQLDTNNKFTSDNSDQLKKQKINIGAYGSALQGVGGPLAGATRGISTMTTVAKGFIATPIGAALVIIGGALAALTSFFRRSEEGQDAFRKGAKVLSTVLDNLLDIVDALGEGLFNAWTKPEEALERNQIRVRKFVEFFKNSFGNIIGGSIEVFVGKLTGGFARIGLAWQKFKNLFVDNADGIIESQNKIEEAGKKVEEGSEKVREGLEVVGNAYDNVRGKIKSFRDEIIADAEIGRRLADEEAKLRKLERRDLVENARLSKESAKLRAEAEKLKLINAEKSLELFSQSFDLDEKILASELKIAERKAENARISATLARSDIKTLDEIATLEADIENKRKAFEEIRRQRTRRLNAIRLEAFKQEKERLNVELELAELNAAETIRLNERIIADEISTSDQILAAANQNMAIRLELLAAESDIALAELNSRHELALIGEADFESQKLLLQKEFSDQSLILFEDKLNTELQLIEDVEQAKFDVALAIGASIEALFEKNTIAAKFAAIAQALINTYLGATAAFAQTPGGIVIKSLAAAAAVASGLASVRKIRQTQIGGSGGGGGGGLTSVSTGRRSPSAAFLGSQGIADGGLSTQNLINRTADSVAAGFAQALADAPPVLVIDDVTFKQKVNDSISRVTTV